jgi:hypothetical protein
MEFVCEWRNETNMSRFAICQGLSNAKIAEMPPGNSPSPTCPVALSFLIFFGGVKTKDHTAKRLRAPHGAPSMMRAYAAKSTQNAHIVAFWEQPGAVWEEP